MREHIEIVTVRSDVSGKPDARTYEIMDPGGNRWTVDLTDQEAAPMMRLALKGRRVFDQSKASGRLPLVLRGLDEHVRNID